MINPVMLLLVIPFLIDDESKEAIMKNMFIRPNQNRSSSGTMSPRNTGGYQGFMGRGFTNMRNMQNARYRKSLKDNTPREIKNKEQLEAQRQTKPNVPSGNKEARKNLRPDDIRVKDMKNIDVEENKQVLTSILPFLNPNDKNIILKFQDMIDIAYKLNRISSNVYDKRYADYINDLPFLEKAQSVIKSVANNVDTIPKQNVDNIIQMLQNIDEAKRNLERVTAKGQPQDKDIAQSVRPLISKDGGKIEKLKNVLKILNDEL